MTANLENLDEELKKKISNMQIESQNLEFITRQKQQSEYTLVETERAIEELEKLESNANVYKNIGGIMVKSEKNKLLDEKKSMKVTLEMRLKTLNQKEERIKTQLETLRRSIQVDLQNKNT